MARTDLDAMRPFMAGWRAQIAETYSADDIARMARNSREARANARAMAAERRNRRVTRDLKAAR